ncbi:hypothetical protein [Kiloniella sp. b19]|uniref:hypothetical protein n=1 Tax=Kiloniella sp. GXU_MW_B19 TaxID=3141326 RepID=UPI0031E21485
MDVSTALCVAFFVLCGVCLIVPLVDYFYLRKKRALSANKTNIDMDTAVYARYQKAVIALLLVAIGLGVWRLVSLTSGL